MAAVSITHDQDRQATLWRVKVPGMQRCAGCRRHTGRFRYFYLPDGIMPGRQSSAMQLGPSFCGLDCWRSYVRGL